MDPAAFHTLVLAEVDAVYRFAFHLSRSHHEAEDLVQETYLRALKAVDYFQPGEHGIRPWLFKILHNVLHSRRSHDRRDRDALRQLEHKPMEEDAAAASSHSADKRAFPGSTVAPVDWDSLDERLYRAIRTLPVAYRTVFLLCAVEELKYREIADIVGVPVGTVMSRLSRARVALAAQLGDLAAEHNLDARRHSMDSNAAPTEPKP